MGFFPFVYDVFLRSLDDDFSIFFFSYLLYAEMIAKSNRDRIKFLVPVWLLDERLMFSAKSASPLGLVYIYSFSVVVANIVAVLYIQVVFHCSA